LELVQNHVPETLVIDNTEIDVGGKLLAGDARIHGLVAVIVVASCKELFPEIVNRCVFFRKSEQCSSAMFSSIQGRCSLERGRVLCQAVHRACFARHALDQHADGHPAGKRVRIDDDIWSNAAFAERHIDVRPFLRAYPLLAMSGRKLVADDRCARDTEREADLLQLRVASIRTYPRKALADTNRAW
jgi:hypothetical protein